MLSLYALRYCLTASTGFGRQFAKLRALSRLELTAWLEAEGFQNVEVFGDQTFDPPGAEEERLHFLARRA